MKLECEFSNRCTLLGQVPPEFPVSYDNTHTMLLDFPHLFSSTSKTKLMKNKNSPR